MKLLLCFAVTVLGASSTDADHLVRRDVDDISIEELMQDEENIQKWGSTGGGSTGVSAGGSDKCRPRMVTGGNWQCYVKEVEVPINSGRGKREAEGRWAKPTVKVPTERVLRTLCTLTCENSRYKLVGNPRASCDPRTGKWIQPASAYCEALNLKPDPPKTCQDLTAANGVYKCTGSSSARQCSLQCSHGAKSTNGRYHFNCHYGHWDGKADCTAASKCQVPGRKPEDKGYWHCNPGPCQAVTSSWGRKKRADDGEDLGRWGAPQPQCLICHFKCDPIHKLKGGGKAQCRMSDGVWIEKTMPVCHMGHHCEWPTAGPMGCYECKDNLMDLGYSGLGFSTEDEGDRREINFEDMEEVDEDEDYDSFFRKKRDADKKANKKARKAAAKSNQDDGIARWSPPPPPTYPPPTWWNAAWECKIHCARFHHPRSGHYTARCKLDSSTWSIPPTECVYRTPCKTPSTSNGSFQCWETTILPEEGDEDDEEEEDEEEAPSKNSNNKKKKKKGRRSAGNSTEPVEDFLYRGDDVDFNFSPNPIGRWGPPSKPPKPDQKYWNFDVRKECVLTCNDCYDPTNKKSVCVNGDWLEGNKPGKCDAWNKCPDKPWWPIGNGYWSCTGGAGRVRTCGLQCYDYHIVQPIMPRLPAPEDPSKVGCDNKYVTIDNGWMECHTNNSPVDCMIMCNKGYTPNSNQAAATCSNGDFLPAQTGGNSWACVPGTCSKDQWGEVCWSKASMGRKKRAIEADEAARKRREADSDDEGLGRWGMAVSPTSRCDNCDGQWRNQIQCVFDTKCLEIPPKVQGGHARCQRVMEGKQDYHLCEVNCPANHAPVCQTLSGRKRREDEEIDLDDVGRWGSQPVTTAATVTKIPVTEHTMRCDAKTGEWNQRCTCEWNLECAVPQRPNANYECEWVNGVFVCQLSCKGSGEYVPAKWIDTFEFRCKRGVWIEKTPQGCVYEPPCVKPDVENGKLKNCRRETCNAPEDVVMELMPGQTNHNKHITDQVITGGHIGYTGRKRREADTEFTADGKFYNDDGSYTEFVYGDDGVPVTQAADDTEDVITDDDDEEGALASEGSLGRWSFNNFGRCPVRRSVHGGQVHCHSIGGVIGMPGHPVGMPPPMSHHNQCMEKNPIQGGWMECKPNGGICMIMCHPGMVPLTANLFSPCNGRQWNPSQWGCRPGHCNHAIYKEACYDHPNNHSHGRRRSADNDTVSFEEGDEEEQRGLFDRWIAPPPPPPPPPVHYVHCSVSCNYNHRHAGAVNYKCDPRDGSFSPALKGCYNVTPTPKPVKTKPASCLCCDVKCNEWHQGGGVAKCAKGYWFQVDKCDKYGMCGKPANPSHGEYTCLYEHEYGYMSRKRRADEPDYDRTAPGEDDRSELGWSSAKDFNQYVKNLNDNNEGSSMEVGGYRWEQVKQKKMICNLACAPGYVPVESQAVCIDGTWVVKPSYCKPQHKCSAPPSNSNGVWECRVEQWPVGTTPGMPGQCMEKNPIQNGWMECKPNGGICMIMCNAGMVPLTTNLFSSCNGAQWDPSLWGCRPGYCDNAVYKEACWNHPNNGNGRRRRSDSPQPIFSKYVKVTENFDIDDFPEMNSFNSGASDRWEQTQMKSFLVCKLNCQGGTFQSGSTLAKCDLDTGYWHPSPGECKPWVGGSKCAAPSSENGQYNCYSVTGTMHGRKRREDENTSAADEFEDVWQNRANGGPLGRWGQSYMVCDLTCSPTMVPENGKYVAKCDQSSGNWIAPPTNCVNTNYTPKCLQKLVNGGVINCEARERGKTRYDCDLQCYDGFEPIDPSRTAYTCNDKQGTYSPQPIGCKTKVIPPAPNGCVKPTNTDNGNWKCFKQDFDLPYPSKDRTENWDSLPDIPRARRDADGFYDEEDVYDNTNEDEADDSIARWSSGKKPKNFICQVKCDKNYQLSGNHLAVCRVDSNMWIIPPVAFCNEHPKKPGLCKIPTVKDGSYQCKEAKNRSEGGKERWHSDPVSPLMECTLTCKNGYRPGHGRWTATCDQNTGLWQIPPANCIKDVRKCENVPSVQNGFMSCNQQNRNEEFDGPAPKPTGFNALLQIQFTTNPELAGGTTRAPTTTRAPATTRPKTTQANRAEEQEQKTKPASAEEMIGATGACELEPAVNEVKGGGLHCRKDRSGNTLCMIKCDEGFRPWHSNLVILCRNGIYYNRNNPTEVQKNMKCKEAPCDVERFGVACYDHPANRAKREADFEAALNEEPTPAPIAARWSAPPMKTCNVQCNSGFRNTGSPVAECNLDTGEWQTMPGQCEPIPNNELGCAAPDDVAYGEWKCWVSNDSDDMRGASNTLPPDGSDEREKGKKEKKKQKQNAKDRGLFEFVPSSGMSKDEFEDFVDRTYGFDTFERKRRSNDAAWGDAIGRWGSQYFICQLECDAGYELKDINYNKVGCRMSDHTWLKPYIQKKHYCKPIGSKSNPNRETNTNGPCDKPELVPNVKNGQYETCESTKSKKRCDLKCDAGYAAIGSSKWVCKNEKSGAEVTEAGGKCEKAPEIPSPPGSCKPPSTWKATGKYSAGVHDSACDGDPKGKKCFITYNLECKPGYKPFGPSAAVCRPKKSFWEVMPTHCLPAGFEAPKKWNMDSANLDAYFTRSEEWDAMTAEEEQPKWEIVEDDDNEEEDRSEEAATTTPAPETKAPQAGVKDNEIPVGFGQCVGLPPVPNYDMGKEKVSNKKVGWECSNTDEYLDGTVCKPICGPGSMPTGINNVCTCDKKGRCKWKGYIKDHCQRMMCPPLPTPVNADYIKTPKKESKELQRMGGSLPLEGGLTARWGSQYKKCPLGVEIPKSKVMCTLRCAPGMIVKGARKATTAKAACKCDEVGNCKWVMKSNECVAP